MPPTAGFRSVPSFFQPAESPPGFTFCHVRAISALREALDNTATGLSALIILNWVSTVLTSYGQETVFTAWLQDCIDVFDERFESVYPLSVPYRYILGFSQGEIDNVTWQSRLDNAVNHCDSLFGPEHPNTVVCRLYLVWSGIASTQDSVACDVLQRISDTYQLLESHPGLLRVNCQVILGRVLVQNGDTKSARHIYHQAIQDSLLLLPPLRAYRAVILERLADLETGTECSVALFREVYYERLSVLGPGSAHTTGAMCKLHDALCKDRKMTDAQTIYDEYDQIWASHTCSSQSKL